MKNIKYQLQKYMCPKKKRKEKKQINKRWLQSQCPVVEAERKKIN